MKKIFFIFGLFLIPILALVTACGSKSNPSSPAAATATATPTPNVSTLATLSGSTLVAGIAVDSSGNVYAADDNNGLIWKVTSAGVTSTLVSGFTPAGLAIDPSGNLYTFNGSTTLVKITSTGSETTETISGITFSQPEGFAINSAGTTLYVADDTANEVDAVNLSSGVATNVAAVTEAFGVAVDPTGNLYVTDNTGNEVYEITAGSSTATLLAGTGAAGYVIGSNASAKFNEPIGITVDAAGHVYVACISSYVIQEIYGGSTSLFAGTPNMDGDVNGAAASSKFDRPYWITEDASGNFYVWDDSNHAIRKIEP